MKIIYKKIGELTEYGNNPRYNEDAIKYVMNSIKEFGFKVPIVIDKNGVIVTGHTRYKASKKLGLKEVPCIIADDLSEDKIKAFRVVDNKVSELSKWDYEKLVDEFEELDNAPDMIDFGFTKLELSDFLEEDEEDDNKTKERPNPACKNKERVLINYVPEDEKIIRKILGISDDEEIKGSYSINEILEWRNK